MPQSDQLANQNQQAELGWSWLQSKLDRTELLVASHELDEWIDERLRELETQFKSHVTSESEKVSAGSLIGASRKEKNS